MQGRMFTLELEYSPSLNHQYSYVRGRPVLSKDLLIDGHHRYAICHQHGIPFQTMQIHFESMSDARKWAFEHQRDRRNVSSYVLAELPLQFESQFTIEAKSNQQLSQGAGKKGLQNSANLNGTIDTRMELAKLAGVSHDTIATSKVIAQKASPEVKEKLRRGEATINSVSTDNLSSCDQARAPLYRYRKIRPVRRARHHSAEGSLT